MQTSKNWEIKMLNPDYICRTCIGQQLGFHTKILKQIYSEKWLDNENISHHWQSFLNIQIKRRKISLIKVNNVTLRGRPQRLRSFRIQLWSTNKWLGLFPRIHMYAIFSTWYYRILRLIKKLLVGKKQCFLYPKMHNPEA